MKKKTYHGTQNTFTRLTSEDDLWTRNKLSAVGYSSSKILYDIEGQSRKENELASRRVSFKLIMDIDSQLKKIKELGLKAV